MERRKEGKKKEKKKKRVWFLCLTSGRRAGPSKLSLIYLIKSRLSPITLPLCSKAGTYWKRKLGQGLKGYEIFFFLGTVFVQICLWMILLLLLLLKSKEKNVEVNEGPCSESTLFPCTNRACFEDQWVPT